MGKEKERERERERESVRGGEREREASLKKYEKRLFAQNKSNIILRIFCSKI